MSSGAISAALTGTGALVKSTPGVVTLSGANTYAGGTTIIAGTLQIGGAGSLGGGSYARDIQMFDGTLEYSSSAAQTLSGVIAGGGALMKDTSSSTLTLTGANTYSGPTTVSAGTLQIGGAGSLGGGSYAGAIVDNGTFQYSSSADQDLTGVFSGSGSLIKDTSPSLLRLSGDSTNYTGETTVSAGILSIAGPSFGSALAPAGPINIGPGGIFSTSGASSIFSTAITNAGFIDNDGTIIAGALSNLGGASLVNNGMRPTISTTPARSSITEPILPMSRPTAAQSPTMLSGMDQSTIQAQSPTIGSGTD